MTYSRMIDNREFLDERHELAVERIKDIGGTCEVADRYYPYFNQLALFLLKVDEVRMSILDGTYYQKSPHL